MAKKVSGAKKVTGNVVAVIVALFFAFPTYWMVATALKPRKDLLTSDYDLIPFSVTGSNFATAWAKPGFLSSLGNSLMVSLSAVAAAVVIGLLAALADEPTMKEAISSGAMKMSAAVPALNSGAPLAKWSSRTSRTCGLRSRHSTPGAAVTETKSRPKKTPSTSPVEKIAATGRFDLSDRPVCGQGLDHGFGGWSGRTTLSDPAFPALWAVRSRL